MSAGVTVLHGDCLALMAAMPDASVDSIVTDPPYGLGFMGKAWDDLPPGLDWARECLRVLKPGGHLLAFGGTRTWHRLACAVEDAGFEMRDSIAWLYGSGFPKSLDVSKAIDKAAGAEREVVGASPYAARKPNGSAGVDSVGLSSTPGLDVTAPATPAAQTWQGWGTALKPAFEPVVVARKPIVGTVAQNVLTYGTGALNVDGCRVATDEDRRRPPGRHPGATWDLSERANPSESHPAGRWPANVVLDESQAAELDAMSGNRPGAVSNGSKTVLGLNGSSTFQIHEREQRPGYGDQGGASRFFYVAKAPTKERPKVDGIAHPTVKPLTLMRWLVRLATPPGGTVLDTFAGSGPTGEAAIREGFDCILIEREADYLPLIEARIARTQPRLEEAG